MPKYGLGPPRAVEPSFPSERRLEACLVIASAALAQARREAIALGRHRKAIVVAEFKVRDARRAALLEALRASEAA